MENKQNFAGIIIPVIVAVILLTVLPIINSMNVECPPCEECPSYNIGNMEVNPDFSSGNYNVDKGSYDYFDSVTIIKDENLIPENIKKDIDIFGVVGTTVGLKLFEVGDVLPKTTNLIITSNSGITVFDGSGVIKTDSDNFTLCYLEQELLDPMGGSLLIDGVDYQDTWFSQPVAIIDTSSWSLEKRTISTVDFDDDVPFFWVNLWG